MNTFEQVLDMVNELSVDQRELLVDIIQRRTVEERRHELAITSQEALEEFRSGTLTAQPAQKAIDELQTYLSDDLD